MFIRIDFRKVDVQGCFHNRVSLLNQIPMKNIITGIMFCFFASFAIAQTATDFTANDCNGNSHHFFSELDSGKIIVLCWVMPCGSCTGPALTTYNVVQSYQVSYPDKVYYYLVDDYANTVCASLNTWANSSGIAQSTWSIRFCNSAIKMTDYGANAMPKIVVVGSSNHTVFFTANNTIDSESLQNGINAALASVGIEEVSNAISALLVSPNPAENTAEISFALADASNLTLDIYNLNGQKVEEQELGFYEPSTHRIKLNVAHYATGMYIVRLNSENASQYAKFNVIR